ncbi:MAG: hypothetical protein HQ557_10485 [Bacteroidetes bacterium]|nr:hypothetical protein [Bacteroidota bacterium]
MKKLSVVFILLLLSVSLFANGARENAPDTIEPGFGRINGEAVTISGTLNVTDAEVILLSDEGDFSLSAPRARMLDLESFNDLYATVTGTLSECDDCEELYDGHIFIESAEVDGVEYNFGVMGRQGGFRATVDSDWGDRPMFNDDAGGYRNAPAQDDSSSHSGRQMPGGMHDSRGGAAVRGGSGFGGRGSI